MSERDVPRAPRSAPEPRAPRRRRPSRRAAAVGCEAVGREALVIEAGSREARVLDAAPRRPIAARRQVPREAGHGPPAGRRGRGGLAPRHPVLGVRAHHAGLLVLAVVVLAPSLKPYVEQRQQIAELRAVRVDAQEAEVARARATSARAGTTRPTSRPRRATGSTTSTRANQLPRDRRSRSRVADDGAAPGVSDEIPDHRRSTGCAPCSRSVMTAGLAPEAPAPTPRR